MHQGHGLLIAIVRNAQCCELGERAAGKFLRHTRVEGTHVAWESEGSPYLGPELLRDSQLS